MTLTVLAKILKLSIAMGLVVSIISSTLFIGALAIHPSLGIDDVTETVDIIQNKNSPQEKAGIDTDTASSVHSRVGENTDNSLKQTSSLQNEYPVPDNYTLNKRIDEKKYAWDTQLDPEDPGYSNADTRKTHLDSEDIKYYVFKKTNEIRQERGLEPFKYSLYLSSVIRTHSEDMAARNYFSHVNPDGEHSWDRFGPNAMQKCGQISENIAKNYAGSPVETTYGGVKTFWTEEEVAEALVMQWMHSPPHKEAMLSSKTDILGVGVYVAEHQKRDGAVVYSGQMMCDYPSANR